MTKLQERLKELQQEIVTIDHEVRLLWNKLPNFDVRTKKLLEDYDGDETEMLFDLPYAQTTDKNGYWRIPLAIVGKKDGYIHCIETGEDQGTEYFLTFEEVDIYAIINVMQQYEG